MQNQFHFKCSGLWLSEFEIPDADRSLEVSDGENLVFSFYIVAKVKRKKMNICFSYNSAKSLFVCGHGLAKKIRQSRNETQFPMPEPLTIFKPREAQKQNISILTALKPQRKESLGRREITESLIR